MIFVTICEILWKGTYRLGRLSISSDFFFLVKTINVSSLFALKMKKKHSTELGAEF